MTLPRVTAILGAAGLGPDLSAVAADVLAAAQTRGTAVHAAAAGLVYGYLDEATVPAEVAPYVSAFRKFLAESGFEPIAAEVEVVHPTWRYVGHPDLIGWLLGRRALLDVKTGGADGAAYQVAAYVEAWNAQHPDALIQVGAILHLREDGTYRFEELDLVAAARVWFAALVVYQARMQPERSPAR